jgi:hypothetical protein
LNLSEFRGKSFSLLWRGRRDRFRARDFHSPWNGHANTLTLSEDTKGNIFGGFTPLKWESRTDLPYIKADPSLKRFVFTLKNPHNVPARRFALKDEEKNWAIISVSDWSPCFPGIAVFDSCNEDINGRSEETKGPIGADLRVGAVCAAAGVYLVGAAGIADGDFIARFHGSINP